jgi:hypothetical protein
VAVSGSHSAVFLSLFSAALLGIQGSKSFIRAGLRAAGCCFRQPSECDRVCGKHEEAAPEPYQIAGVDQALKVDQRDAGRLEVLRARFLALGSG